MMSRWRVSSKIYKSCRKKQLKLGCRISLYSSGKWKYLWIWNTNLMVNYFRLIVYGKRYCHESTAEDYSFFSSIFFAETIEVDNFSS
jgi:hypothetical protein